MNVSSGSGAALPPPIAAPAAAQINNLARESRRTGSNLFCFFAFFLLKNGSKQPPPSPWGEGRGEPLFEKVSHFPSLTGRPPAPLRAPGSAAPSPRARARVSPASGGGVSSLPLRKRPRRAGGR